MKTNLLKRIAKKSVLPLICFVLLISVFLLMKKYLPQSVSYKVVSSQSEETVSYEASEPFLKENLCDITEDGPFTVKTDRQSIYVYSNGKPVYKVRAFLYDLPEKDKFLLRDGIETDSKDELYNLVSTLES